MKSVFSICDLWSVGAAGGDHCGGGHRGCSFPGQRHVEPGPGPGGPGLWTRGSVLRGLWRQRGTAQRQPSLYEVSGRVLRGSRGDLCVCDETLRSNRARAGPTLQRPRLTQAAPGCSSHTDRTRTSSAEGIIYPLSHLNLSQRLTKA